MAGTPTIELENDPPESLFHQLFGGRSHIEVNVSKVFATCFRESPSFAEAVLLLLCKTCTVPFSGSSVRWHCHTEVAFTKGRPDIEIHSPGVALFRLESKVGAPLTKNQLLRYRFTRKGGYLIAVTKRPPDVERGWLAKKKIFAIRWQDVHRAVAGASAKGRERYLRDSFCLYLEELGMAHREDVRPDNVQRLHDLFDAIGSERGSTRSASNAFDVAESCLHLLREVARDAREEIPNLQNWSRRGPHYTKWVEDAAIWHHLGFHFHKSRNREQLGAGFSFRQGGRQLKWEVWRRRKGAPDFKPKMASFKTVCGKGGALDRGKMLLSFKAGAKALGIRT